MVVLFDMAPRQSRGGKLDYVERLHRNTQFFQKQYPYFSRTIMQLKNHKFFLILENPKTNFIFFLMSYSIILCLVWDCSLGSLWTLFCVHLLMMLLLSIIISRYSPLRLGRTMEGQVTSYRCFCHRQ